MLKKLLKYEFKSVSRKLLPVILGTLALAILTSALFSINNRMLDSGTESVASAVFSIVLGTLMIFSMIAIVASVFVVLYILLQRYYRNFFCDEGYFTFTLPVKISQHLTVKLISGVVWMALGILSVLFSFIVLIAFGTAANGQIINTAIFRDIFEKLAEGFDYVGYGNGIAYMVEIALLLLVEYAAQMLLFYLAITIGSIIAKKHKILASIGVFLGINAIVGSIANIGVMLVIKNKEFELLNDIRYLLDSSHLLFILFILFYTIMGVVSFIICSQLLNKKLNLE